jgi:hypothetical protein
MSKLETNTIDTVSGTTNLTIGSNNSSTVTFESGAATGQNYPAFSATLNTNQSLTQSTYVKVIYDTEVFDTDSAFDTSTGRFTVPSGKAGKYFFTATVSMLNNYTYVQLDFYKNGSSIYRGTAINNDTSATNVNAVIDLSASDYVEVYCRQSHATNSAEGGNNHTHFHGYRIGA